MVIHDLDVVCVALVPAKTNPPLLVDAGCERLSPAPSGERAEAGLSWPAEGEGQPLVRAMLRGSA